MVEKKRFQSGREIFEKFIPDYESDDGDPLDASSDVTQLVETLLVDFSSSIPNVSNSGGGD